MKNKLFITILIFSSVLKISGQENHDFSIHKYQQEYYKSLNLSSIEKFDQQNDYTFSTKNIKSNCELENIVFGWHPWWSAGLEDNYRWDLLSDLSFFSYEVDYLTGDPLTTHNWESASVIDDAQANNVRVNLCVTLFNDHQAFFANSSAQQNLIDNLLTLVGNRNADGVNIDFESIPTSEANNLNNFLVNLATQFHNENADYQVSIALPAVNWSSKFDIDLLKDYIDLFIIMGYNYYYGGSDYAGPTGQLYMMYNFNYTISRSIVDYFTEGVPKDKLVCGIPYYGFDWQTVGTSVPTETVGNGSPIFINEVKTNSTGNFSDSDIDEYSMCKFFNYYNGNQHQAWIDDEITMKYKYDLVKQLGIAGIGIWALGYDDGYSDMWDLLETTFTDCAEDPWSYPFYDLGGPNREHFENESYEFTIQPDSYTDYLALVFHEFELESEYDSLWIYDGANTDASLIGGYSGTTSPGIVEASGNALTLKFYSDGATEKLGWNAEWRCSPVEIDEIIAPDISVYPNPFNDQIKISSEHFRSAEIISVKGNIIKFSKHHELNTTELTPGVYLLKIITDEGIYMKKIIKN